MKTQVKKVLAKGKINLKDFNEFKEDLVATTNAEEILFEKLPDSSEIDYEVVVDL